VHSRSLPFIGSFGYSPGDALRRILLAFGLWVGAVSCQTVSPGVLLPPDDPRPAQMLAHMQAAVDERAALRASARLSLESPDLRFDRPQRLAVERPARLRVEVIGLFDQVAVVVVTNGGRYQVFDVREGRLEEGEVTPDLLWRVARVDLEPAEAVSLLLGAPQPQPGLRLAGSRVYSDGSVSFDRRTEEGVLRERHRFDVDGHLQESERFDEQGLPLWSARFDHYREVRDVRAVEGSADPAVAFAFDVELHFPRVDARARLRFDRVDLASSLPGELFVLKLPDGAAR